MLERIKEAGDIFWAESDRPWILDGANVHVSMVGFDGGNESSRILNGHPVPAINANLTAGTDTTRAHILTANRGIAFMGDTKGGAFDLPLEEALDLLHHPNPNGRPSSDVLVPWCNGLDLTRRPREVWIVDFGTEMPEEQGCRYEAVWSWLRPRVEPVRAKNARETYRKLWWRHVEARPGMRAALTGRPRFLVTTTVSKHRLFAWFAEPTLPDHQLIVFARDDDFFLGVLHSRVHEVWALRMGTRLETRPRYTPTTCFETFPFPYPEASLSLEIATTARELDALRSRWLNPPEWVREEVLEFPGAADGPWARWVVEPDVRGIGTVRWPRLVPRDADCAAKLAKRTLTNLYNERPAWLDLAHRRLDELVLAAYGWPADLADDDLLARLLALNLERAAGEG